MSVFYRCLLLLVGLISIFLLGGGISSLSCRGGRHVPAIFTPSSALCCCCLLHRLSTISMVTGSRMERQTSVKGTGRIDWVVHTCACVCARKDAEWVNNTSTNSIMAQLTWSFLRRFLGGNIHLEAEVLLMEQQGTHSVRYWTHWESSCLFECGETSTGSLLRPICTPQSCHHTPSVPCCPAIKRAS